MGMLAFFTLISGGSHCPEAGKERSVEEETMFPGYN
jgi:hypothetical protein